MPVTVVVGGQFGSEGKGKVAHHFADQQRAHFVVRVGGSNSGHTVIDPRTGVAQVFRHLPTAALLPNPIAVIAPGSYLEAEVLQQEIRYTSLGVDRLVVDPAAVIIEKDHALEERDAASLQAIGSTLSGTGAAVRARIERNPKLRFAKDIDFLRPYIRRTTPLLRDALKKGVRVLIEGTQGFGLSPLHSPYYPYVTSRDTTSAAFVSEAGLSPLDVDHVILVLRAFPIRVAGTSGPLKNEITWDILSRERKNSDRALIEYTSVTRKVRRVARFDPAIVKTAIEHERPTTVVLNHVDYFDARCGSKTGFSSELCDFVVAIERAIERDIDYIGLGRDRLCPRYSLSSVPAFTLTPTT